MLGAIIGDIVGSPYEFHIREENKNFPLFQLGCTFSDDTIMTVAVLEALLDAGKNADDDTIRKLVVKSMRKWGVKYPCSGYGIRFNRWLFSSNPDHHKPYNSCGNGSAMRVSSVGWLYDDLETVLHVAELTADVTHNHPEGIKGAQATAAAIFLARTGSTKSDIKTYITEQFGYDLSRSCDEIRPNYVHVETCQETVPEAITAFLEGESFEDVIRTAVTLGGDCDTLTAIAGSIAEAFYGIPTEIQKQALFHASDAFDALKEVLRRHPLPHYVKF